ncbi:hypothetical protein Taro_028314 [Colocasia esculenta]|uniref:Uncharacterized protein n=1 Tax=Colocasia esculenta TaxID=4460 RepID=A0A843VG64_COLES|nr:hypothetical protein [Colocasia esculenta]
MQKPRPEEPVSKKKFPTNVAEKKTHGYRRLPRGFGTGIRQAGAYAYAHFHNKRAELRRCAYLSPIREDSLESMISTTCERPGATRVTSDHTPHLINTPLRRERRRKDPKAPRTPARSFTDESDVPCGHRHEHTKGAKPRASVFKRLCFPSHVSRRAERDQNGNIKVFACHMAGIWGRYGALPANDEELAELAERPGAITRRRAAAAALAVAYGLEDVPTTQMTAVSANVVTAQGSGGNDDRSTGYGGGSSHYPFMPITDPSHTFHSASSSGHHITKEHVIEEDEEDEIDSQDDIDDNENMDERDDEPLFDIARVNNTEIEYEQDPPDIFTSDQ